ncbi:unnamed protein product [Vitrella brassicaformis CCMP3155]|uniref:Oocyst wall protein n=2 Tax=Vitrella brassicaformis TaxID=1169539 RepID=A0A0G4H2D3_VITBC|nr:unnamed protein product [Vitrella brassicaformis CCMP3155]|mmetsp:Transcript_8412/g.20583  ORF Transcript_8412/g.20583 Transcript_8412/m.20583 type:complete len:448 (+) Transcript_8412:166-1509(+)|eukprot:CEM37612.1 unnamed protein product [Vitrella brassicaformis CCMP3155]
MKCGSLILLAAAVGVSAQYPSSYGDSCPYEAREEVHYPCPYGYDERGGTCVKMGYTTPYTYCPLGMESTDDGCVKYKYAKKVPYCKTGKFSGLKCVDKDIVDVKEYKCPYGFDLTDDKTKCYTPTYHEKLSKCPEGYGFTDDKQKCVREAFDQVTYHCPEHTELTEEGCKAITYDDKKPVCSEGYVDGDKCVVEKFLRPSYRCGGDLSVLDPIKDECITTITQPCGFEAVTDGRNVKTQKHCSETKTVKAIAECTDGYELDGEKGLCVGKTHSGVEYKCTDGYELTDDETKCFAVGYEEKKVRCVEGYELTDGTDKCVKYEYVDLAYYCPEHTKLTDMGCQTVHYAKKQPYCNDGVLEGGKCVVDKVYAIDYKCPDAYEPTEDNSKCFKKTYADKRYYCPSGYSYDAANEQKCVTYDYAPLQKECFGEGKLVYLREYGIHVCCNAAA